MAKQNICGRPTPVLPSVYQETLTYGETLGVVAQKVNECVDEVNENDKKVDDLTNLVGTFDNRITENTNNIAAEQAARKAEDDKLTTEVDNLNNTVTALDGSVSDNTSAINKEIEDRELADNELAAQLANKVDKIADKGLSTNDFTNEDKAKVDAIPADPKYTDTTYTAGEGIAISDTNVISATNTGDVTAAGDNTFTGNNDFGSYTSFINYNIQFSEQEGASFNIPTYFNSTVQVPTPILSSDATNREYVDNVLKLKAGLSSANTFTKANTFNGPIIANNSIALRGSISGTVVSVSDVSPLEHNVSVKASSAAVQVIRCGKNVFDAANATKVSGGSSFTNNNGVITVSENKAERWNSANVPLPKSLSGNKITITCKTSVSGTNEAAVRVQWVDSHGGSTGEMIFVNPDATGNIKITGVVPNQPDESHNTLCLMFYSNTDGTVVSGTTYTATYSDIQIETGSTATTYTPYQGQQTYTPETDGTVLGVISLSPDMTLMTDKVGVVLDMTYNRDINAALAQLQQAILSLGGNV